jgi:hypothetical protein
VHRLLSIVDVARRLRPLVRERTRPSVTSDIQRRLDDEVTTLFRLLGLDESDD